LPSTSITISANDLSKVIKANINAFDYTARTDSIKRFFEHQTGKRITFASFVLAFLHCGFGVIPHGQEFRLIPYTVEGLAK